MTTPISNSQQRILKVILALAGHELHGLSTGDVAKMLNISAANASRDLSNLQAAGIAEKMENGRWHLTPKLIKIAIDMHHNLDRIQKKIKELRTL